MKRCSFEDVIDLGGAPKDVFAVLEQVERWPEHFPHVRAVNVLSRTGNVEELELVVDSRGKEFRERTRRTIAYPTIRFDRAHPWLEDWSGTWEVEETAPARVRVTLRHEYRVWARPIDWLARYMIRNNSRRILDAICAMFPRKEAS